MTLLQHNTLQSGLAQMNLSVSPEKQSQLLAYLQLLQKWNQTYNLTAITDFEKMITHHLLDSLSVSPFISGDQIADVGSGAGLPGIPLAIQFPEKHFVLMDSVGKKTRFISHAARELGLKNVSVFHGRAEEYQTRHAFDTMIARAVASVDVLIAIADHLLQDRGVLLMMKSDEIPSHQYAARIEQLQVPGIDTNRMLIMMEKKAWQK